MNFAGPGEIVMTRGKADFDVSDFANQPVADNFGGLAEWPLGSLP